MTAYILNRLLIGLATLVLASVVVFGVMEVLPGDPAQIMLGMSGSPEALANLRAQMGLDQPLLWRYLSWIGGLIVGDFGRSYTYAAPVADLIRERLVVSLPLALISLVLSTVIAIPVGIFAAARRGRLPDTLSMGTAQLGQGRAWSGPLSRLVSLLRHGSS